MKILPCCQPESIWSLLFRALFCSSLCFSSMTGEKCPFFFFFWMFLRSRRVPELPTACLTFICQETAQQPLIHYSRAVFILLAGLMPFPDLSEHNKSPRARMLSRFLWLLSQNIKLMCSTRLGWLWFSSFPLQNQCCSLNIYSILLPHLSLSSYPWESTTQSQRQNSPSQVEKTCRWICLFCNGFWNILSWKGSRGWPHEE